MLRRGLASSFSIRFRFADRRFEVQFGPSPRIPESCPRPQVGKVAEQPEEQLEQRQLLVEGVYPKALRRQFELVWNHGSNASAKPKELAVDQNVVL